MLPHELDLRTGDDGLLTVVATFDLTAVQVSAACHAARVVREARHRTQAMTADDVLVLRELTSLVDELAAHAAHGSAVRLQASPARLGTLRDALETFAAGEHVEREGDAGHRPVAFVLADGIADLHAAAVRAALDGVAASP